MTNLLAGKKILILDDDPVVLKLAEGHFKTVGADEINIFEDLNEAWVFIKRNDIDCFVIDWQLGNKSSLSLFTRIRLLEKYRYSPLAVICGKMKKSDLTLLDEFPCTSFIQKPFTAALITNLMSRLVLEQQQFLKHQNLIGDFMKLTEKSPGRSKDIYEKLRTKLNNNKAFEILAVRTFREHGHLELALHIAEDILSRDKNSIPILTELAKIYHALGKSDVALSVLRSTLELSPKSFERLMLAGQVHLEKHETERAADYFSKALEIDEDSKVAQLGLSTCKNMNDYFAMYGHKGVPGNLASLLNIIAVSMVRNKQVNEGIDQYLAAMEFAQSSEDKARVAFNLGLGFLRSKDLVQAGEWFTKSIETHPVCKDKATEHLKRMNDSQMSYDTSTIKEDEILGGFIEPQESEDETKEKEEKAPQQEEEDFDSFLDSFDIDDD